MKAHAIEQICRKSREVYVYRRGDADFVGDGNACCVATWARGLRPNDLLELFGVAGSQGGIDLLERAGGPMLTDAMTEGDVLAKRLPDLVRISDEEYVPFEAGEAVWLVANRYLLPFGRAAGLNYFVRPDADGYPHLIVKQGMLLQAVIDPLFVGEAIADSLQQIADGVARSVEYLDTCGTGEMSVDAQQTALAV
ncbi:MAG: hypothetical protein ACOYJA_12660 [Christensenellales bacterium]|jgi:hypothetical protein